MSFLSPLLLMLATLAAVPLLVHLLRRRIGTRVDFPAARYLARAEREHSRHLRLRNLLLMLLRVAIVLLVAMAAAKPVGRVTGTGQAPTALAIVIDNSLSSSAVSSGRSVLDELRDAATGVIAVASPADRLWLVAADGTVRGGSATTLTGTLDRVQPLAGSGDLPRALLRAAQVAAGASMDAAVVVLLTDGQATTWDRRVVLGDVSLSILTPALDTPFPGNRAVVAVQPEPLRWTPSGTIAATVITADSVTYRVELDGSENGPRTLARGTVSPGERDDSESDVRAGSFIIRAAPAERGWVAGSVKIEPDELRADDRRHFALWIGEAPTVFVHQSAGVFVAAAAASLVDAGRFARGGDVTITGAAALERLPAIVVAPSDPVRAGAANRALERAGVPWRFGDLVRGGAEVARFPGSATWLDSAGIVVTVRYRLIAQAGAAADTLATVGGDPWIVAGDSYVLVSSPLEPDATTLPVRAAFVPWLYGAVAERLAGAAEPVIDVMPGDTIARPAWAHGMEHPDGNSERLVAAAIAAPASPGVYFLLGDAGERAGALVVNSDPAESVLARLPAEALAALLEARDVDVGQLGDDPTAIFSSLSRRSLVTAFLIAALIALLVEAFVSAGALGRRA